MTAITTYRNRFVTLDGARVHYIVAPGPEAGPTFLLVHGLGGSLDNWFSLIPLLTGRGRVVALDLGGFGLTEVPAAEASLHSNLGLLERFTDAVCDTPVIVVGNSMGGMLAAQLAARAPRLVAGTVLIDPALPPGPWARPHPMVVAGFSIHLVPGFDVWALRQREGQFTPRQLVESTMALVTTHPDRIDPAVLDAHIALAERRAQEYPEGDEAFAVAARTLLRQFARRRQFTQELDRILTPVLLVHGERDLLINVRSARATAARHPGWTYAEGADRGHVPFLDFPGWVAEKVLAWLDEHPEMERRSAGE